jgi:hypothetical protein
MSRGALGVRRCGKMQIFPRWHLNFFISAPRSCTICTAWAWEERKNARNIIKLNKFPVVA